MRTLQQEVAKKLDCFKLKRSKKAIERKKLFQSCFKDVSPIKVNLFSKPENPKVKSLKSFLDEEAVPLPHKQACTSTPKKILSKSLKQTFKEFNKKKPENKVSLRTVYRHKPKHIITNTHHAYRQCLCEYCSNIDLKLEVSNKICTNPVDSRDDLSERSLCENLSLNCLDRSCGDCGVDKAIESLGWPTGLACKWKCWETVENRRVLVDKEGDIIDLRRVLSSDLVGLSKHLHTKRWQFMQYRTLKLNLPDGTALGIFDFAENYLCQHQDEVQSAHWAYKQVTVHPCCLYYACPTCQEQVTDYLVILSDDIKHDAHLVRSITERVKSHLSSQVSVHKLYVFTDGCGPQYKSKLPFFFLAKDMLGPIEVEKSFFGSRHGKSPCDSCGGVVKSLAARDVASSLVTIQSAADMHAHMTEHHTLPREGTSESLFVCTHTKRSFVLLNDIDRPIDSSQLKTIPGTRKIHQMKRVDGNTIGHRNLSCFCQGCLGGNACVNTDFVLPWETKTIPNLIDFTINSLDSIPDRLSFFLKVQEELLKSKSFEELKQLSLSLLPLFSKFDISFAERFFVEEVCQVDSSAIKVFGSLLESNSLPLSTIGDGNCFPRALSFLVFGSEAFHVEIRCRICVALATDPDLYLDRSVWSLESDSMDIMDFLFQHSEFNQTSVLDVFCQEVMACRTDRHHMGLWQFFAASVVLSCPIQSLYPNKGWFQCRQICNRLISPPHSNPGDLVLSLLWTSTRDDMEDEHWVPNHFVPVIKLRRPFLVEVVSDFNQASMNTPSVENTPSIPDPTHKCDVCNATFSLQIDVRNHIKVHFDEQELMKEFKVGKSNLPTLNSFYKILWSGKLYVAQVTDLPTHGDEYVGVRFMEEKANLYSWPERDDTSWEHLSDFLQEVVMQIEEGHSSQRKQWFSCSAIV